jgi:dihydrofolate reductase
MGRIIVTEFVSLDGVMEAPGGGEDYKHVGWTFEINRGEEGNKFKIKETSDSEALLLGRVTYEGFAKAWPSREGEFADKFNRMPKYVISSTLKKADWNNSTILSGDVIEEITKLKKKLKGNIVVHGSAQLVQAQRFRGHSFLGGSQHLFEAWVIPDQVEVRVYLGVMNQTSAHLFECWSKHL